MLVTNIGAIEEYILHNWHSIKSEKHRLYSLGVTIKLFLLILPVRKGPPMAILVISCSNIMKLCMPSGNIPHNQVNTMG
jgi:hypothetical protein